MKVFIVRVPDKTAADGKGHTIVKVPDDQIKEAEAFYEGHIIVKGESLGHAIQQFSELQKKDNL